MKKKFTQNKLIAKCLSSSTPLIMRMINERFIPKPKSWKQSRIAYSR